jgi:hypothetical protein
VRIKRARDAAQGADAAIKAFRDTIHGQTWGEVNE